MIKERLVKYYENKLAKVNDLYSDNDTECKENDNKSYIEFAEKELTAVKNGRKW